MAATVVIHQLAERLQTSDPANAHEQRELFERIRELRSAFDGPLDPESHRYLEAASMLVAYLSRMGLLAGDDVRTIAVRLLKSAAEAEDAAVASVAGTAATAAAGPGAKPPVPQPSKQAGSRPQPAKPDAAAPEEPERSATDLMGEMMLGQILLQRGHILEEHIHQAMKVQRATSLRIGDIFVKIGACTRAQLDDALTYQASLRRVRESLADSMVKRMEKPDTRGTGLKLVGEAMLGEILIERSVITRRQLERALEHQKLCGRRIGEALVELGATTMEQIEQALRVQGRDRRFGTKTTSDLPPAKGKAKGKKAKE